MRLILFTIFYFFTIVRSNLEKLRSCPDVKKCPQRKRLVSNGEPNSYNGCGPMSKSLFFKLANVIINLIGRDFTQCCNAHDLCYGTCGASRNICDKNFYNCMKEACERKSNIINRKFCKVKAFTFYISVHKGGKCFFNQAQNRLCVCK